ncbi:hypothetical protein L7F22_001831 [Adiantum nelumboides]|nr:hypothetical protein [Adiantum nelumboides]
MDDTDPCLCKARTSVLSSPTVIARRKRMEIRRFKKLSRSTQLPHDKLSSVVENSLICIKRARIERAITTGSFSDPLERNGTLTFTSYADEAFLTLCKGKEPANLHDHGLPRCKSMSPYANGALEFCTETDVYNGSTSMKEEQLSMSPTGMSEVESGSSSPAVVCIPASVCEGLEKLQSQNTTDNLFPPPASVLPKPIVLADVTMISDLIVDVPDVEIVLSNPKVLEKASMISDHIVDGPNVEIVVSNPKVLENAWVLSDLIVDGPDMEMVDSDEKTSGNTASKVLSSCDGGILRLNDSGCPHSSKLLICGRRREMEDTATIAPSFAQLCRGSSRSCFCTEKLEDRPLCNLHFFAIYDGHGGNQASNYCMERLHHALAEELSSLSLTNEKNHETSEGSSSSSTWEKVMSSCFSKVDQEVGGVCPNGQCDDVGGGTATCCGDSIAPENVGTTATVAVVSSCQIVVANCGDSRAVLSRGGAAIPLSRDHKPERDDETSRIEAAGGRVMYWDGYRVGGLLALSRSIGDRYLKRYVVSEPEVTYLDRTKDDECLIIASDGLWDVISNDTACEIARKCLVSARRKRASRSFALGEDPASATVAALLVKLAYSRGSKDNISAVVIDLKS